MTERLITTIHSKISQAIQNIRIPLSLGKLLRSLKNPDNTEATNNNLSYKCRNFEV